jgi:hypothetical protein
VNSCLRWNVAAIRCYLDCQEPRIRSRTLQVYLVQRIQIGSTFCKFFATILCRAEKTSIMRATAASQERDALKIAPVDPESSVHRNVCLRDKVKIELPESIVLRDWQSR